MDANVIFESLLTTEGRSDPYPLYAALHRLGGAAVPVADAVIAYGYDAIDAVLRDPAFRVTDAARLDEVDPSWRDHPALGMDAIGEPESARSFQDPRSYGASVHKAPGVRSRSFHHANDR
jgi:cytochrome P450